MARGQRGKELSLAQWMWKNALAKKWDVARIPLCLSVADRVDNDVASIPFHQEN
jgi:hypothetical protein